MNPRTATRLTSAALAALLSTGLMATAAPAMAEREPVQVELHHTLHVEVRGDQVSLWNDILTPDPATRIARIEWRWVPLPARDDLDLPWTTLTGPLQIPGYDVAATLQYRVVYANGDWTAPHQVPYDRLEARTKVGKAAGRHGTSIRVPVTVTGVPDQYFVAGKVVAWTKSRDAGSPLAVATVDRGRATLALPAGLSAGKHRIRVQHRDDRRFASTSQWVVVTVAKATSRTKLVAPKPAAKATVRVKVSSTRGVVLGGRVRATVTRVVDGRRVVVAKRVAKVSRTGRASVKLPKSVRTKKGTYRLVVTSTGTRDVAGSKAKKITWRVR